MKLQVRENDEKHLSTDRKNVENIDLHICEVQIVRNVNYLKTSRDSSEQNSIYNSC